MGNRKKLGPTLILVLALALAPISWANGPERAGSLGPLDWLSAWIGTLIEEFSPEPVALHPDGEAQEIGNLIVPSG